MVLRWCSDVRERDGFSATIPVRPSRSHRLHRDRRAVHRLDQRIHHGTEPPLPGLAGTLRQGVYRKWRSCTEPTTDQKVRGSSPFGRATSSGIWPAEAPVHERSSSVHCGRSCAPTVLVRRGHLRAGIVQPGGARAGQSAPVLILGGCRALTSGRDLVPTAFW